MENSDGRHKKKIEFHGVRFWFAAAGFLGFMVNLAVQINLNVAIVVMVNNTAVYHDDENASSSLECKTVSMNSSEEIEESQKDGEFMWTSREQGIILGAFYYGFVILQIPGGRISDKYNAKWVYGLGTFIPVLLSIFTPIAAQIHIWALIVLRALEGLAQGLTYPAIYTLLSDWAPDSERGVIMSVIYAGISVGTLFGMTLTGYLCSTDFLGGWPSSFYVIGAFGCVWFIFWCTFVTDTPRNHPFITDAELKYITSNQQKNDVKKLPPFPWLKVLRSLSFWSFIICYIGGDWGFFVMLTKLPTFFSNVLHFDIKKSGFLSSFPYVLKTGVFLFCGFISDLLLQKKIVTVAFIRKFSTFVSHVITSLFLFGVCLAGCNVVLNVVCFIGFVMFYGFNVTGICGTPLDLSPEFAGTLSGIAYFSSSLMGFVVPVVVGIMTDKNTLEQWQLVFGMSAVIKLMSGLFYILCIRTDKQDWADTEDTKEKITPSSPL